MDTSLEMTTLADNTALKVAAVADYRKAYFEESKGLESLVAAPKPLFYVESNNKEVDIHDVYIHAMMRSEVSPRRAAGDYPKYRAKLERLKLDEFSDAAYYADIFAKEACIDEYLTDDAIAKAKRDRWSGTCSLLHEN